MRQEERQAIIGIGLVLLVAGVVGGALYYAILGQHYTTNANCAINGSIAVYEHARIHSEFAGRTIRIVQKRGGRLRKITRHAGVVCWETEN